MMSSLNSGFEEAAATGGLILVQPSHAKPKQFARALESEGFDVDVYRQQGDLLPRLTGSTSRPQAVVFYSGSDTKTTANLCRYVRRRDPRIALLIIAAREAPRDECVAVLDAGADDYLVSPGPDELIARIRSITRRHAERAAGAR